MSASSSSSFLSLFLRVPCLSRSLIPFHTHTRTNPVRSIAQQRERGWWVSFCLFSFVAFALRTERTERNASFASQFFGPAVPFRAHKYHYTWSYSHTGAAAVIFPSRDVAGEEGKRSWRDSKTRLSACPFIPRTLQPP